MPLPLVLAAAPVAIGAAQAIAGAIKKKNNVRPEYQAPPEIQAQLDLAQGAMNTQYAPGQINAQNQTALSQANALAAASEGVMGANANVSAVQAQADKAYRDLYASSNAWRDAQRQNVYSALQNVANSKDMEWQLNKYAPYVDKYNESREMIGAGMQNIMGGVNSVASMMMSRRHLAQQMGAASSGVAKQEAVSSVMNGIAGNMAALSRQGQSPAPQLDINQILESILNRPQ